MNTTIKPKLISFEICPFVQRAVILLLEKEIDFDITYIDLKNKPDWFLAISPFGKVPVLQIGEEVIFESSVIVEYLDEAYPHSFHPADLVVKAKNRAWTEFASGMFMTQFQMVMQPTKEDFDAKKQELLGQLEKLESIPKGPYFNGSEPSLVDFNFAPFFLRLDILKDPIDLDIKAQFPNLAAWSSEILKRKSTTASVPEGFTDLFQGYVKKSGSFLASKL
ncbi:MAG: glutathione S-transferase family protein [SAR324 cluster bacterium]|nr:glutathione S-transferase family protein [SAR324 cluster bacterium]